ncbi:MAG: SpoIIE family protein phosphatase [Isosphaeraceae bacterium]|nr:SpoIIE family protein phosphatase [Isosphaeraceae bacterium]
MPTPKSHSAKPSLMLFSGETPGRTFELERDVTTIGRSSKSDIVLSRISVSRKHAQVLREGESYYFEDLGSDSGSRVDGKPVRGRVPLNDGSLIEISRYFFSFSDPSFHIDEDSESVILGSIDLSSSVDDRGLFVKPEEKLRHILELSRNLGDTLHLDSVLAKTLETLFNIFPHADRAFVVLKEGDEIDEVPRAIKFRGGQPGDCFMSRTVFNLVMNEGKGILSTDVPRDDRLADAKSINASNVRTMMCVPLLDQQQQPRGILQLDTRQELGKFRQDDLDLLAAVAVLVGVAVDNARLHAAQIERIEIEVEERDARQVQLAFLPNDLPMLEGYEFWHSYEPSRFVGGDYFDYLPVEYSVGGQPVRWFVALGDVVGKGMPAALLMARLSAEVRLLVLSGLEPAAIVARLNHDFCRPGIEHRFITILLLLLDGANHQITVVSAGHMGPMVRRADGRIEVVGEESAAYPIGIEPDTVYRSSTADVRRGDTVILYTDGVNEVMNPAGKLLGTDRLMDTLRRSSGTSSEVGESILKAVRDHAAGKPQSDDITLICFTRL